MTAHPLLAAVPAPDLSELSLDALVKRELHPQLEHFFVRLAQDGEQLLIDGVPALRSRDHFLPGKIALGLSYVLLEAAARGCPRLPEQLQTYSRIADLTAPAANHSWGIYYYLLALTQLDSAGLLSQAVSPAMLSDLRQRLDWRSFVRKDDLTLIDLPSNYYGVAFSVSRLRQLLGWDAPGVSERLLEKTLAHYDCHSGEFGFSDETDGDGRFDRYSILLIAEICQRFVQTNLPVPERLRLLLRKAVDVTLKLLHGDGHAFSFGRSLGPYGDSAAAEILSVAGYLGVLQADEKRYAYTYCTRSLVRYLQFWFDPAIHSVDMWGKGRRTDSYRAKHRILGENFSLIHQYIACNALWNAGGLQGQHPQHDLGDWLSRTQPAFSTTWFARDSGDRGDRALVLVRDGRDVFSLPLINGGPGQHANSPYYPLPFAEGLVAGIPDSGAQHPQLLPLFTLADGSELLPTSFIRSISSGSGDSGHWVGYTQDALNRLGANAPVADPRLRLVTRYEFEPGRIVRTDCYTPTAPLSVARISLEFLSFSEEPVARGNSVQFSRGRVRSFEVEGLQLQLAEATEPEDDFKSPSGPMRTRLQWTSGPLELARPLTLRWTLIYDAASAAVPPPGACDTAARA
ncbi:MAG: hypothetical protein HC793_02495 [Aquincola sp.]|nr:hypothetical protein [Aquincola sp.]